MIITGYQGIGKSTLASKNDKIIDLESGCFWKTNDFVNLDTAQEHPDYTIEDVERSRPKDWYIYYCQMAEHLSKQGYIVFVSCHPVVREYLSQKSTEPFCAIFPAKKIKYAWLDRLSKRYNASKLEKDLRALRQAENSYDTDISRLCFECQHDVDYYHNFVMIDDIDYDLQECVDRLIK